MNEGDGTAAQFDDILRQYYGAWLRYHPEAAVDAGVGGYEQRLTPYGEEARGALVCLNDDLRTELDSLDRARLDPDRALDFDLAYGAARIENQGLLEIEPRQQDPGAALPVHAIYQLTIRPVAAFADALRARLEAIPGHLHQARREIAPQAASVPPPWLADAVAQARAGAAFLRALGGDPRAVASGPAGVAAALEPAAAALGDYAAFLENEVRPAAAGDVACGRAYFESLLAHRHFLEVDVDALHAFGTALAARVEAEMRELCGHDIERAVRAAPPPPDRLLQTYREQMQAARAFVAGHDLASLPEVEALEVVATPAFLRHQIPFAAYDEPSPNDRRQLGHYYVTPPAGDEDLAEHGVDAIAHTCVHEAWPGHHLQFVTANAIPAARTLPRLLNASATLVEGWALYCEQLMHEQGFLSGPAHRFILLRDRLWRALRVTLDIEIHTRGLPLEEAAEHLVRRLGFSRSQALAEVTWYSRFPTVPLGYATGWALINALRDRVRADAPAMELRAFHDRLLSVGSIALAGVVDRAFGPTLWEAVRRDVFPGAP